MIHAQRGARILFVFAAASVFFLAVDSIAAQPGSSARAASTAKQQQSLTPVPLPPMGWASWNSFSNTVDAKIVAQQAQALVSSGMAAAGYKYVLIDEGWWLGNRDKDGNIVVDPRQWPAMQTGERDGDMRNIVRYLHGMGLKAGIYTDAGSYGCSYSGPDIGPPEPHTGSIGHYRQDFTQFARWGFDYVKVDWCGGHEPNLDPAFQYGEIARAIAQAGQVTGNTLFFSICDWGVQSPWTWAPGIGDLGHVMWRAGGDIVAPIVDDPMHAGRTVTLKNILKNFDAGMHPEAQHTGYSNDLDMMVLGMRGTSDEDDRVHMALWSISGAALMQGADLTKLTPQQIAILTNPEVLAVDQDPLGLQCVKMAEPSPGLQVWAKPLAAPGERAVVLLNRTGSAQPLSIDFSRLGLAEQSRATVRDLWARHDIGSYNGHFEATVSPGDAMMLTVSGTEAPAAVYKPSPAEPAASSSSADDRAVSTFTKIEARSQTAYVTFHYQMMGKDPVVADVEVNGDPATRLQFLPTGQKERSGAVAAEFKLDPTRGANTIAISTAAQQAGATVDSIEVASW